MTSDLFLNRLRLFVVFVQRWSFKPQNVFLYSAITWGTLTVFITPPFQVPDEPNHFFRAYQVAGGTLFPVTQHNQVGGFIPSSMIKTWKIFGDIASHPERKIKPENISKSLEIPLNPENKTFAFFPNTGQYLPFPYIPQFLAIITGKLFNAPPLILLYLGRLLNLFSWIIMVALAIRITPVFKWFFLMLALTPMSVFQASSFSADALIYGTAFFYTAFIFKLAFDENRSPKKYDLGFLIILLVFLILSKYVYFFLFFLCFLIPVKKAGNIRNYLLTALLLFVIAGIAVTIGGYFVKRIYESVDPAVNYFGNGPGIPTINPDLQVQYILTHVGSYIESILLTFWKNKFFISTFIGNLGWLDTPLPVLYILAAFITLILMALGDGNENVIISIKRKSVLLFSLCSVIFVICTLLYVSWTPVGGSVIDGFQGRYLIPVAPVAFALLYNRQLKFPERTKCIGSIIFIVISFLVMNYSLISRYYLGAHGSLFPDVRFIFPRKKFPGKWFFYPFPQRRIIHLPDIRYIRKSNIKHLYV